MLLYKTQITNLIRLCTILCHKDQQNTRCRRVEENNPRINMPIQANKGKQIPRTMPTQGELKSQIVTGTPQKLKDKGVDGKGKVQDMQKWRKEVS